jgi:hypothetical protein
MAGWTNRMLDIRAQTQSEKQRRATLLGVLRNLPERGAMDERRADGSRTLVYIQQAGAATE